MCSWANLNRVHIHDPICVPGAHKTETQQQRKRLVCHQDQPSANQCPHLGACTKWWTPCISARECATRKLVVLAVHWVIPFFPRVSTKTSICSRLGLCYSRIYCIQISKVADSDRFIVVQTLCSAQILAEIGPRTRRLAEWRVTKLEKNGLFTSLLGGSRQHTHLKGLIFEIHNVI